MGTLTPCGLNHSTLSWMTTRSGHTAHVIFCSDNHMHCSCTAPKVYLIETKLSFCKNLFQHDYSVTVFGAVISSRSYTTPINLCSCTRALSHVMYHSYKMLPTYFHPARCWPLRAMSESLSHPPCDWCLRLATWRQPLLPPSHEQASSLPTHQTLDGTRKFPFNRLSLVL